MKHDAGGEGSITGMRNQELSARAERHSLSLPVRYRLPDEEWWSAGILENLSATGVLIHVDRAVMVGSAIVINLHLLADRPIRIIGRGSVVRLTHLPLARHPWIIAATIPIEEMRRL